MVFNPHFNQTPLLLNPINHHPILLVARHIEYAGTVDLFTDTEMPKSLSIKVFLGLHIPAMGICGLKYSP